MKLTVPLFLQCLSARECSTAHPQRREAFFLVGLLGPCLRQRASDRLVHGGSVVISRLLRHAIVPSPSLTPPVATTRSSSPTSAHAIIRETPSVPPLWNPQLIKS